MNRTAPDIAVNINDLRRTFGDFVAVDSISLTVARGEIFGFLGPNGAGKSTTIRMLCGLLLPTSGGGSVGGFDIFTRSESIKGIIGYMSQRFSLYGALTVEENINFFSGIYGVAKGKREDRKAWILEMAGLTDRRAFLTKNLAAGFKQRLALGCAILHEPAILFLDEPTSGVDPLSRRAFWDLIRSLADKGTTVFVTTHYMEEADYCDRLALIYRGKIIAQGTPLALRTDFMEGVVIEAEVDQPMAAMELLSAKGCENAIFGAALHITVAESEPGKDEIIRLLEASQIKVARIEEIRPSLEDVFVHLIEVS